MYICKNIYLYMYISKYVKFIYVYMHKCIFIYFNFMSLYTHLYINTIIYIFIINTIICI